MNGEALKEKTSHKRLKLKSFNGTREKIKTESFLRLWIIKKVFVSFLILANISNIFLLSYFRKSFFICR